jgi:hypothetical protein
VAEGKQAVMLGGSGSPSAISQKLGLRSGHPYVVRFLAALSGTNCPKNGLNVAVQLGDNSQNLNVRAQAYDAFQQCENGPVSEGQECTCTGVVSYHAEGSGVQKPVTGSIMCSNEAMGRDPAPGVVKSCSCQHWKHQWELFEVATNAQVDNSVLKLSTTGASGCSIMLDDISVVDGGVPATYKGCTSQKGCKCTWAPLPGWPTCSETCGTGKKLRNPKCLVDDSTSPIHGTKCPEPLCPPKSTLELEQTCTSDVGCKYEFVVDDWAKCTEACGASSRSRSVKCHKRKYSGDTCSVSSKSLVADLGETSMSNCLASGVVAPMPSGEGEEDYEKIMTGDNAGAVAVDSCGGLRPSQTKYCQNFETCTCSWECDNWGECAKDCGTSTKTRNCNCYRSDGTNGVDGACCVRDQGKSPELTATCTNYDKCNYRWHIAANTGHSIYEPETQCTEGLINTIVARSVAKCRNRCDKNGACRFYSFSADTERCKLYESCVARSTASGWNTYTRAVCKDVDGWSDTNGHTCNWYRQSGRCDGSKVAAGTCNYGYQGCRLNQNAHGTIRVNGWIGHYDMKGCAQQAKKQGLQVLWYGAPRGDGPAVQGRVPADQKE